MVSGMEGQMDKKVENVIELAFQDFSHCFFANKNSVFFWPEKVLWWENVKIELEIQFTGTHLKKL